MKDFKEANLKLIENEINGQGYVNEEVDHISDKEVDITILSEDERKINFFGEKK